MNLIRDCKSKKSYTNGSQYCTEYFPNFGGRALIMYREDIRRKLLFQVVITKIYLIDWDIYRLLKTQMNRTRAIKY